MRKILFAMALFLTLNVTAQNIKLPEPNQDGGMPLMETLNNRKTVRSFQSKELTQQQLSDLLWAGWGVNRESGKRTAPSAMNYQETDLYVLLKNGVYVYNAEDNKLVFVSDKDERKYAGTQDFIEDAPVQLVLVADLSRMSGNSSSGKLNTAYIDAGYISQNIYLWCASEELGTGARAMIDHEVLSPKLKLDDEQRIIIAHSVGHIK
ncbi:MAG TPA: SagB/ThcOx family dehydrogenase [Prolixibacteraceae bacterium]|nr:SagB/ThcOx family dehydrogenase [Prolixibacteraceae bacterium]